MPSPIKVLYEDPDVIVFDKPSGLLVVPDPHGKSQTLENIVNEQYPLPLRGPGGNERGRLYPCHRLDRDTSGVIIFARGKTNQDKVMDQFRNGLVQKTYIAFVRGKMKKLAGEIKSMIRDFHDRPRNVRGSAGRSVVRRDGKLAVTRYKVLAVKHQFSVVEVHPLTGRTNQIRIHLSELGHPILGERLYAFGKDFPVKFGRIALHAEEVTFKHPVTGAKITAHADLAKDMENFLNRY